jgi:uncharacterized protein (TIGR02452 family)
VQDPRSIRRDVAAALGAEAVLITHEGRYVAPSGAVVEIAHHVERALEGCTHHPPSERLPTPPPGERATRITTRGVSTLAAARALVEAGRDPAALNFASARNPGGGFLNGARAQEESLCRASALYACIVDAPMYPPHRAARDPMYTSWTLYAPMVPVFRDDDGALLERPWRCSFVTSPAPNVKVLLERQPERAGDLSGVYDDRIARVLSLAAMNGHDAVVLGAWGCGAFGGDPEQVAGRFERALAGAFRGVFDEVVFAVLDTSPDRRTIGPFERRFPLDG